MINKLIKLIFLDANSIKLDNKRDQKMLLILVFFIRFILSAIPLYFVMGYFNFYDIQLIQAKQVFSLMNPNESYLDEGKDINLPLISTFGWKQPFAIDAACTGYRSFLALFGLIIATPNYKKKYKLLGIILSIPILWFVNIFRIYFTIMLTVSTQKFDLIHGIFWRWGLTLFIVTYWFTWFLIFKIRNKYKEKSVDTY